MIGAWTHWAPAWAANLLQAATRWSFTTDAGQGRSVDRPGCKAVADVSDACRGDAVVTMLANDFRGEEDRPWEQAVSSTACRRARCMFPRARSASALSKKSQCAQAKAASASSPPTVFGRPDVAAAGQLFIVVAGQPSAVEPHHRSSKRSARIRSSSRKHPRIANLVKLSGNFLIASAIEALGEAMRWSARASDRASISSFSHRPCFRRPRLQDLWRTDCFGNIQTGRIRGTPRLQGHSVDHRANAADDLRVPMPLASCCATGC